MGPLNVLAYASRILPACVNIIQDELGVAYPIVKDLMSDVMWRLLQYRLAGHDEIIGLGSKMLVAAEQQNPSIIAFTTCS